MELGEKLRQARLEAGMSQRQLCGDKITRNMLSLIESGLARPSMDTLRYLASRLGKTLTYFLEEDALTSPNQQIMEAARDAYETGQYLQVLTALQNYTRPDPIFDREYGLLLGLSLLSLARTALQDGKRPYARQLLAQAGACETPYWTPALERERRLLLARSGESVELLSEDEALLLQAEQSLSKGLTERCICLLEAVQTRGDDWQLLRGQAAVAAGDHTGALPFLIKAEESGAPQAIPLLEICYRQLEDYKMAYHYACKQKPTGA